MRLLLLLCLLAAERAGRLAPGPAGVEVSISCAITETIRSSRPNGGISRGNLIAADGREFGYQLTFFRQGVMPMDADIIPLSRFVTSNVKFAHFAVSDISGSAFHFFQKLSRGAYGEAGFGEGPRLAWIEDWSCTLGDDGAFRIKAKADDLVARAHV